MKIGAPKMIKNPILPGFNPDPCITKKGDAYYIAVSSFEWFPGIPIYHSKDLQNWELLTHVLTDDQKPDLKKLPSAKGIWAPCLTYDERDQKFYVVYGVMNSMNARYFDVDNYLITSDNIEGPWSEPVYLHSSGFDASILHDDDGRKWIVSLEWETRDGYEKPGFISVAEYDPINQEIIGYPKKVWTGGTDRGCIEAPHLTKRNGYYYLMCAEGGTGYGHSVTMARSKNVFGPYEGDPKNPILTSIPGDFYERHDPDHLKPKYYNPESYLQKSGHGSYIDLPNGQTYLVHLSSRPFVPELRCSLGRETAIQEMEWSEDGWLRLKGGGNLAKAEVNAPDLPELLFPSIPEKDCFDEELGNFYYSPRIMHTSFTRMDKSAKRLVVKGQESLCSLNKVSLIARKLTSIVGQAETKLHFDPEIYQHSAGLVVYYDNMNYVSLYKTFSEKLQAPVLSMIQLENGERKEFTDIQIKCPDAVVLAVDFQNRDIQFSYATIENEIKKIGPVFNLSKYSDEYCKYGEFTGTFVGMFAVDSMFHRKEAQFEYFEYTTRPEEEDFR